MAGRGERTQGSEGVSGLIPAGMSPIVFEGFETLDTKSPRAAIADTHCAWLDGFMPAGPNYLRCIPDVGAPIFTAPTGKSVVFYDFGNIGSSPIMIVFLSDGSVIQVNTSTGVQTVIGGAGTITNPSQTTIGVSQWGSSYIIIVSKQTNGYFLWDGANLYSGGSLSPSITIQSDGLDYSTPPTITLFGGSGLGASVTSTVRQGSIQTVSVTNPGSGYGANDYAVLVFNGVTATATSVLSSGSVSSVSINSSGSGYTSTASVLFLGGGGYGATGTVQVASGTVSGVSVTAHGQGYLTAPTPFIYDANNPVAQAYVGVMPTGISGTAVETYTGRVWVTNGSTMLFTAPGSLTDFSTGDGAGAFASTDSFLRVSYIRPRQTNGFMYLVGDSSVNYVSGVSTSGTPAGTTFTNQNADPEVGSPYPCSVQVYSRNLVFANAFGVHVSYGGAVTKISDALDGIYTTVPNFGGMSLSAGKAIIFGQRLYVILVPVIDPFLGRVNKLFMWNGKQWWSTQQSVNLSFIAAQEINSVLTTWGTDGKSIYPLFQNFSTNFTKTVQSKLFPSAGSIMTTKQANRLWGVAYYYAFDGNGLNVSIDNESGSTTSVITVGPQQANWTNSLGASVTWVNSSVVSVVWGGQGSLVNVFPPTAVAQQGALLGLTVSTTASDIALIFLALGVQPYGYRG